MGIAVNVIPRPAPQAAMRARCTTQELKDAAARNKAPDVGVMPPVPPPRSLSPPKPAASAQSGADTTLEAGMGNLEPGDIIEADKKQAIIDELEATLSELKTQVRLDL